MVEFFYRTEDIKPDEVLNYFVETKEDRSILKDLKAHNPVILIGGRGVGKSFLLRVAENELLLKFETKRILPIYVTFNKSSLIYTNNQNQFQHWMLARLCSSIIRTLKKVGLLSVMPPSLSILTGNMHKQNQDEKTKIEEIAEEFEQSWKNPGIDVDTIGLPSIDDFKDAIEDLCYELNIVHFVIFIDEADKNSTCFFWIHRDAPEVVNESLRILAYQAVPNPTPPFHRFLISNT